MHALRDATRSLHHLLDSQLPLARPDAGVADYLSHLRVLRGWLLALAPLLQPTGWGQGYLQALDADLAQAGAVAAPVTAAAPADDPAFALGVAYVVEGSQLGGQVLLRRLRQSGVDHGLRYLQGRGEATGAHWGAFLKALRARLTQPAEIAAACRGACWAFEDLLARMRRAGLLA
ncbi:biliverdin-producing heme oxygenase [Pseudorhodoferax sp. Leaf267]|uniref:biliverdin-producing heme oxygenase n=1 Tax=Pseudorhodoferax sp. Leaf267 TaxID=1736316 RepID=UPI0006FE8340|nr:biliverdin-producing heme oxygenase [Pseudorhodoferax sp. Leaf267]KQP17639.1 hypothetical protein ASF43_07045 [Pseudorhodoferax sp. Leaf267]